jgi:hypothetical protein
VANLSAAVTVRLFVYTIGVVVDNPPTPVTAAVVPHGVIATPVYTAVVTEHVTVTVDVALLMVKFAVAVDGR